jgi:hypothetical protein
MSNTASESASPVDSRPDSTSTIAPAAVEGDTMERLFQALFYRIAAVYSRTIPKHIRRLEETAILVLVETRRRR